jgi:hypothetical protein
VINPRLVKVLNHSIANPEPQKDHEISFYCGNSAKPHPATEATLPSSKSTDKRLYSSAPKQAKKCSKDWKQVPTAKEGENGLLGGFPAEEMDKDAFISKYMLEDKLKVQFNGDPKLISQLEESQFAMESLFKYDSSDDKISFSCNNSAGAQPTTDVAIISGKGANKKSCSSTPKQAKKRSYSSTPKQAKNCSRKQIQVPIAQKGEHALLGGFPAEEMDKGVFISKCMLEDKSKLEFDCNPKSISQLEKLPFEMESLFKDDGSDDKISFSCDNNAEAQPATKTVLPSGKGANKRSCSYALKQANKKSHSSSPKQANKRSRSSTPKQAKKCSKEKKHMLTVQKGEHALLGGFPKDETDKDAFISKCMLEDKPKLEFDCDSKLISQLEELPFETKDALNGGFPADELDEDTSNLKCMLNAQLKVEFDCNPKSISQLEKFPSETESLFNDDSNSDWWTRIPTLDDLVLLDM